MEARVKNQIDDLVEYTISLKSMYDRVAALDSGSTDFTEDEKSEIESVLFIINKALEIENRKIAEIDVNSENFESIINYLIGFYEDTEPDDYFFENHLERARIASRLTKRLILDLLTHNISLKNKNIDYAVCYAIESNYIYAANYECQQGNEKELFTYLKYGKMILSPFYDVDFFPDRQIRPIVHYSHFKGIIKNATEEEIKITALSIIKDRFLSGIKILSEEFSDEAMQDDSTFIRAMNNLMIMNASLISTLDPDFIDSAYLKYLTMKNKDPNFDYINSLIKGVLVRSKKQVLNYRKNKDSK